MNCGSGHTTEYAIRPLYSSVHNARCGAADVVEVNKQRKFFLKSYYWETTVLNSNFLVERLCGLAHPLPRKFVFLASGVHWAVEANSQEPFFESTWNGAQLFRCQSCPLL